MGKEKPPSLAFLIQSFLGGLALDSRLPWYRTYSLALRHLPLIVFHILGVEATWSEEQPYVFDLVQSAWLWCSWFYLYKQWGQFEVSTIPELTVWLALPSNCPQSGFPSPFSCVSSPHRPHPGLIPSSPHAGSKKTASVYHINIQSCLAARLFFFFWHYFFVALFVFCLSSLDTGISPYWDCTLFFQLPAVLVTCSQVLSEQIKWKIPETKQLVLSLKLCSSQVVWWSLVLTPSIPPGVQTIHLLIVSLWFMAAILVIRHSVLLSQYACPGTASEPDTTSQCLHDLLSHHLSLLLAHLITRSLSSTQESKKSCPLHFVTYCYFFCFAFTC